MSTDDGDLTSEEQTKWAAIMDELDSYGEGITNEDRFAKYLGPPHPDSSPDFKKGVSYVTNVLGYLLDKSKTHKHPKAQNYFKRQFLKMIENPLWHAQNYKKQLRTNSTTDVERWDVITKGTSPRAIAASIAKNYRNVTGRGNR
jgi:hypothetical protein